MQLSQDQFFQFFGFTPIDDSPLSIGYPETSQEISQLNTFISHYITAAQDKMKQCEIRIRLEEQSESRKIIVQRLALDVETLRSLIQKALAYQRGLQQFAKSKPKE
jgi:hypothetical protein